MDFLTKQEEYWQNEITIIFDEMQDILDRSYSQMDNKIKTKIGNVKDSYRVKLKGFEALQRKLENYIEISEESWDLEIRDMNNMI